VEKADYFAADEFCDAAVAVPPDAGDNYAAAVGKRDIDVCAFRGVQAAAHAYVAEIRAAFNDVFSDVAGVEDEQRISIAYASYLFLVCLGDVAVDNNILGVIIELLFRFFIEAHRL